MLFVIPWDEHSIIGTTDTDFDDSPDAIGVDSEDIEYLLNAANFYYPKAVLSEADVVGTFAGLRPLVAGEPDADPSKISREEEIFKSDSGLITLGGGKLTTHRLVAEILVDQVDKRLGDRCLRQCQTHEKALPGGSDSIEDLLNSMTKKKEDTALNEEQLRHLTFRYGARVAEVMEVVSRNEGFEQNLVSGLPDIWAEAYFAAKSEMAVRPEDILLRRTRVAVKESRKSAQITELVKKTIDLTRTESS